MKVKILLTGITQELDSFWAGRLIEQGKAVPAQDEEKAQAETPTEQKPKKDKRHGA